VGIFKSANHLCFVCLMYMIKNRVHIGNPGLCLQLVGCMWNIACELLNRILTFYKKLIMNSTNMWQLDVSVI
jgi:hypothetical protein